MLAAPSVTVAWTNESCAGRETGLRLGLGNSFS